MPWLVMVKAVESQRRKSINMRLLTPQFAITEDPGTVAF